MLTSLTKRKLLSLDTVHYHDSEVREELKHTDHGLVAHLLWSVRVCAESGGEKKQWFSYLYVSLEVHVRYSQSHFYSHFLSSSPRSPHSVSPLLFFLFISYGLFLSLFLSLSLCTPPPLFLSLFLSLSIYLYLSLSGQLIFSLQLILF